MSVWQYIRVFDHILPEIFINHNFQTYNAMNHSDQIFCNCKKKKKILTVEFPEVVEMAIPYMDRAFSNLAVVELVIKPIADSFHSNFFGPVPGPTQAGHSMHVVSVGKRIPILAAIPMLKRVSRVVCINNGHKSKEQKQNCGHC